MARPLQIGSHGFGVLLISTLLLVGQTFPRGARAESASDVVPTKYHVTHSEFDPGAESQLFELLNQVRQGHGLRPLVMDASLRFAARAHSRDMAMQGYVGHGSLRGESFVDRLAPIVRGGLVGENVAIASTVEQANDAFIASPEHHRNMLEPRFHRVGIGISSVGWMGMAITEDFAE